MAKSAQVLSSPSRSRTLRIGTIAVVVGLIVLALIILAVAQIRPSLSAFQAPSGPTYSTQELQPSGAANFDSNTANFFEPVERRIQLVVGPIAARSYTNLQVAEQLIKDHPEEGPAVRAAVHTYGDAVGQITQGFLRDNKLPSAETALMGEPAPNAAPDDAAQLRLEDSFLAGEESMLYSSVYVLMKPNPANWQVPLQKLQDLSAGPLRAASDAYRTQLKSIGGSAVSFPAEDSQRPGTLVPFLSPEQRRTLGLAPGQGVNPNAAATTQ